MSLVSKTQVKCPSCGRESDVELVRSINTEVAPTLKANLLDGSLNVLACECGKRTLLAADLLFHDPKAQYYCQVVAAGETAMSKAAKAFAESGVAGTLRLVPSLNGLVEKVKMLESGLEDWALEMVKVLLLVSSGITELNTVVLFEAKDGELFKWLLFDEGGQSPQLLTSPMAPYTRVLQQWSQVKPPPETLRIDRAWAVDALKKVMPLPV